MDKGVQKKPVAAKNAILTNCSPAQEESSDKVVTQGRVLYQKLPVPSPLDLCPGHDWLHAKINKIKCAFEK